MTIYSGVWQKMFITPSQKRNGAVKKKNISVDQEWESGRIENSKVETGVNVCDETKQNEKWIYIEKSQTKNKLTNKKNSTNIQTEENRVEMG